MGPRDVHAAHPLGLAQHAEEFEIDHPPGLLSHRPIGLAIAHEPFVEICPERVDQRCVVSEIGDGVAAQIPCVDVGVEGESARDVFVRAVGMLRHRVLESNCLKLGMGRHGLVADGRVAPLDGPLIIRSHCVAEIVALLRAIERDVGRDVIHH